MAKAKFDRQPTLLEVVVFAQFVAILLLVMWTWNLSQQIDSLNLDIETKADQSGVDRIKFKLNFPESHFFD